MRELKFRPMQDGTIRKGMTVNEMIMFGVHGLSTKGLRWLQYTGLEDAKNVEIYEDDLWQCGKSVYRVMFNCGGWECFRTNKDGYIDYFPLHNANADGVVVGNIYQNPELLNERTE